MARVQCYSRYVLVRLQHSPNVRLFGFPGFLLSGSSRPATIESLHQDILAEIFLDALEADIPYQAVTAGQIVAVCRDWRLIALSYSTLWRYIYVHVGIESIYPPIDVLALWIHRSRHSLLHIYIDMQILAHAPCYHQTWRNEGRHFGALIRLLAPTHDRWASLNCRDSTAVGYFDSVPFEHAKELRSLFIFVDSALDEEISNNVLVKSALMAPQLKRLQLHYLSRENIMQMAPNFSWHSLLELDLSWRCHWEYIAQAISECTSIVKLVIRMAQPIVSLNALPKHTILPNLKLLQIDYESIDALKLFSSLECPNLLILGIGISPVGRPDTQTSLIVKKPFDILASFIAKRRHRIQVFRLEQNTSFRSYGHILMSCREADVLDVGIYIDKPRRFALDRLQEGLQAIEEKLENVSTALPALVIRSTAGARVLALGWMDPSRMTVAQLYPGMTYPDRPLGWNLIEEGVSLKHLDRYIHTPDNIS